MQLKPATCTSPEPSLPGCLSIIPTTDVSPDDCLPSLAICECPPPPLSYQYPPQFADTNSLRMSSDSPIASSADVWATLVANIGPLLILVGEGHVKAYFKTMSRTSHHLLFASAPIGLATAISTLIRLNGSMTLKRMIGRQFETRSEVLIDVTSVSSGEVGLELVGLNLEQALVPTVENLAMFWIQGKRRGSAAEIVDWVTGVHALMWPIAHRSVQSVSDTYDRRCSWSVLLAYRGNGPAAVWLARKYALATESSPDPRKLIELCETQISQLDPSSVTTCEGTGCLYSRWSDVSLVLTVSANLDGGLFEILRYVIILVSLCGNIAIITASSYTARDSVNVVLIALGLAISGAGSWLTAWLVDNASDEQKIDLSPLSAFATGFFSKQIPEGTNLSFCPKMVVLSTHNDIRRAGEHDYRGWYTAAAVALMVVAYIGLYLGLRTSPWWVSMSILGISAGTALARSLLVPESLFLKSGGFRPEPLLLGPRTQPIIHLEFRDDEVAQPTGSFAESPVSPPRQKHDLHQAGPIDGVYEVVFPKFCTRDIYQSFPEIGYLNLLGSALQIAYEMRERGIAPLEWEYWHTHNLGSDGIITLYSDLLSQQGVWRQPLELVICRPYSARGLGSVLALVANWHMRAVALPACRIAELSMDVELAKYFPKLDTAEETIGNVTHTLRRELRGTRSSTLQIVWMLSKILYAVTYSCKPEHYQGQLAEFCDGCFDPNLDQRRRNLLLDSIVAVGLAFKHVV